MTNTQLAPISQLKGTLNKRKSELASMLPPGVSVDRFISTALSGIHNHPQSGQLLSASSATLYTAVTKACADGLHLDGKESTLITFNSKNGRVVEYIPMVKGLVKLAMESGEVTKITTYVVRERDDFEYDPASDRIPKFKPDWKTAPSARGKGVLAIAVIELTRSSPIVEIMHEEDIMRISEVGRNGGQYQQGSGKHWEAWWQKTVLKRALKYAPAGARVESVIDNDAEFESGFNEPEPQYHQEPEPQQQSVDPNEYQGQVIEGEIVSGDDDLPL